MNLRKLNTVCFTICIICIVIGVVLALAIIWGDLENNDLVIKAWLTTGVFFLGGATTLSVSKTLGRRSDDDED